MINDFPIYLLVLPSSLGVYVKNRVQGEGNNVHAI